MFVDTVVEDKALHKPAFLVGLSVTVLAFFFAFNFTNTIFGEFLSPVIGNPEESGLFGRLVVSFVLSVIFVLNLLAISLTRIKVQIFIVWIELFLLFLAFAYSFDLKLSFIQSRIGLMISKGLFTTIYISAVSIVIATAIAIVGAIAKPSASTCVSRRACVTTELMMIVSVSNGKCGPCCSHEPRGNNKIFEFRLVVVMLFIYGSWR